MTQPRTKILYVHHGTGMGGAPQLLLCLLQHTDLTRYEPLVWCIRRSSASELFEEHGFQVVYNENAIPFLHISDGFYGIGRPHRVLKMLWGQWRSYRSACAMFARYKPDIIHINTVVLPGVLYAARRYGRPVAVNILECLHPGYSGLRRALLRTLTRRCADMFVFMLPSEKVRWRMDDDTRAVAVFDFIDREHFVTPPPHAPSLRATHTLPNDVPLIGYFGRFTPAKGVHLLLQAVSYLRRKGCAFHLVCVGPIDEGNPIKGFRGRVQRVGRKKTYSTLLREYIAQEKLEEYVTFTGPLSCVERAVGECDILVAPFTEPHFSRVCAEAAAAGKPAVAFAIDGPGEEIINGETGLLATPFLSESLAQKLEELEIDAPRRAQMGEAAQKWAARAFDSAENARKVFALHARYALPIVSDIDTEARDE